MELFIPLWSVHGILIWKLSWRKMSVQQIPYTQTFKLWTFKHGNVHSISVRREWNLTSPSFSSTISHLVCLLQPVTLLTCSLDVALYASCCTVLFHFSRYCKIKKMFYFLCFLVFMYNLYEKYYKPITVQNYIADCVSWIPRLMLLVIWTNWTYKRPFRTELSYM